MTLHPLPLPLPPSPPPTPGLPCAPAAAPAHAPPTEAALHSGADAGADAGAAPHSPPKRRLLKHHGRSISLGSNALLRQSIENAHQLATQQAAASQVPPPPPLPPGFAYLASPPPYQPAAVPLLGDAKHAMRYHHPADSALSLDVDINGGAPAAAGLPHALLRGAKNVTINVHNYITRPRTPHSATAGALKAVTAWLAPGQGAAGVLPRHAVDAVAPALSVRSRVAALLARLYLPLMCLVWYASSALTNNAKKQIMLSFPFPVTVTLAQFAAVAVLCRFAHARRWITLAPASGKVAKAILPLAVFQLAGHTTAAMAMNRVPVAFVHTVKALSPLCTVLVSRAVLGTHFPPKVYLSLVPLCLGVILACTFGKAAMAFDAAGFVLSLTSTLVFVTQSIVSKRILGGGGSKAQHVGARSRAGSANALLDDGSETGKGHGGDALPLPAAAAPSSITLDKMSIMFYSSLLALCGNVPLWLTSDLPTLASSPVTIDRHLLLLFLINGASHFTQALLAFSVLAKVSTVTYSVVSLLKRIVVIVAAIAWFGDAVSGTQAVGVVLAFAGLWMYQQAKTHPKGKADKAAAARAAESRMF